MNMRKTLFLFLLLIPFLAFNDEHEFYVSVTEAEYSEENQSLQVISKVFIDDMEKLLKVRYDENLFLNKKEEPAAVDALIEKYFSQKLEIKVDGEIKEIDYLGKKYNNDQLSIFIEIKDVAPFEEISVKNKILTDLYPEQKNVVHVTYHDMTKSLLLSRHKEEGLLNFGE